MKTRTFVSILILVLAVLIVSDGYAKRRKAISEEDFFVAFSGTWVNTEYMGDYGTPQKMIRFPNGTWEDYYKLTDNKPDCYGKYTITDMWTDSKGNIWYKAHWECLAHGHEENVYGKIYDSGNTLEYLSVKGDRVIEDWDTESFLYNHRIYYRQE